MMSSSADLAAACTTSIRPQPETNGRDARRAPSLLRPARRAGSASAARRRAPGRPGSRRWRAASASGLAGPRRRWPRCARTRPTCWAHRNAVVRQPLASASCTAQTVPKSADIPPASGGARMPYRPASAIASSSSTGMMSLASVATAAGKSTSSASCWATSNNAHPPIVGERPARPLRPGRAPPSRRAATSRPAGSSC